MIVLIATLGSVFPVWFGNRVSVDEQLDLLRYQINLVRTVITFDEHPKERNKLLSVPVDYLLKKSVPTFEEFSSLVKIIAPKDVNPFYLLKSIKMQDMYINLCEHLLNTK